ncbi:glycoside hydrolase family 18 protein [Rubripirellula amarantea]|uniref:chitinase n=1 Tax=Rubripirellula amarantea TaxID=2527999 RepID=A0A5C5WDR9_9BACT|nr:glycoside hydrolase family 18 protein [Rubripirellula amarantea]MDA8744874.1 glycoside hydrolase family 18 protein [Rubripirellula amarantea]TWT48175.1 Chitinase A1 precursor [Rubripirellula amarantea]
MLTLALTTGVSHADDSKFVVAGYLPSYRLDDWQPTNDRITDIIYFGPSVTEDGSLDVSGYSDAARQRLAEIREKTNARILVTVGGWGKSKGFATMASNDDNRAAFVETLMTFLRDEGFDGVDYDWEHPANAKELHGYTQLVVDTKAALPYGKLVTLAMAPWNQLEPALFSAIDRIHLMSYDHGFPQATLDKSVADVDMVRGMGCPASKIVLGIPFYGRNKDRAAKTYAQLARSQSAGPSVNIIDGFAANGPELVTAKVRLAKTEKLAGVMIWEVGQDTQGESSLMNAISKAIAEK